MFMSKKLACCQVVPLVTVVAVTGFDFEGEGSIFGFILFSNITIVFGNGLFHIGASSVNNFQCVYVKYLVEPNTFWKTLVHKL